MRYAIIRSGVVEAIVDAVGGPPFIHAEGREALEIGQAKIEAGMTAEEAKKILMPQIAEVAATAESQKSEDPITSREPGGVVTAKMLDTSAPATDDEKSRADEKREALEASILASDASKTPERPTPAERRESEVRKTGRLHKK